MKMRNDNEKNGSQLRPTGREINRSITTSCSYLLFDQTEKYTSKCLKRRKA